MVSTTVSRRRSLREPRTRLGGLQECLELLRRCHTGLGSGDQSTSAKSVPRVTPSPLATRCNVARVMFFSPRSIAE